VSTFQAELSAGASADAPAVETATAQDQTIAQQTGAQQTSGQQNGQSLNIDVQIAAISATDASATTGQSIGSLGLTAKLTAAQLLLATQAGSHATGKGQKQQAQTSTATAADTAVSLVTVPTPTETLQTAKLPTGLVPDSQTTTNLVQPVYSSISREQTDSSQTGTDQTGTDRGRQLADVSQPVFSKVPQIASQQAAANAALPIHNSVAAAQPTDAQANVLSQADDAAAVTPDNGATGTQAPNQGSKSTANSQVASTYLSAAMFPNTFDASQSAGKANQYKTSATTVNPNASLSNAAAGTSQEKSGSADGSVTSSQSAQAGSGTAQHGPIDASQAPSLAGKPVDGATAQAIPLGVQAASHQSVSPNTTAVSANESAHRSGESAGLASEQTNGAGSGASSAINSARVIQSMSETEMRVGMRSSEFGDISIRTMVSQQQMQAQISVDHNELSNAISAHIPAIQAKLGNEYGLHASIEVSQNSAGFSGQQGQSSQKDQRPFAPSAQVESVATSSTESDRMVLRAPLVAVDGDRLDIRA
jgi:hypothetical protein